jgi:hypothetical protein
MANDGVDTRTILAYLDHKGIRPHSALYGAVAGAVQGAVERLTAAIRAGELLCISPSRVMVCQREDGT